MSFFILLYNPITLRLMTLGVAIYYKIDPKIFYQLIYTESKFYNFALSPAKAKGLGQIKESTAQYIHPKHKSGKLYFPLYNLKLSARYILYLQETFQGNWTLVLAAYNWGEYNVAQRIKGIPIEPQTDYRYKFKDVRETYDYINKIIPPAKKA
ncbi:MAG TPA: transglycosylase SLT domain-containing protein [Candidatus Syntrophosphaera sp.]|nr:transglycosylase SLT domain-containing protein [Candidatus Syntrophosphaera sp.]